MSEADKINKLIQIMDRYREWHIDSPEDSWRLERDIREVLGMPQVDDDQGGDAGSEES